jgi:heptosyltransferase-3
LIQATLRGEIPPQTLRAMAAAFNRILVISLAGIGDTLMATPLIHELRAQFPEADIDALVLWPGSSQVLAGNPHLNEVHRHDFLKAGRFASLRFIQSLRRRRYEVSLNVHPQGHRGYRWIAALIGARTRLSHEYENQNWLDRRLVTHSMPQDYGVHASVNNLRLLPLVGRDSVLPRHEYELFLGDPELQWATRFLLGNDLVGRRFLGIHVGSGGTKNLALRRWPLDRFIALTAALRQSHPALPLVFFGGPDERVAHAELFQRLDVARVLFPESPTLRHAAALLGHAHAFLSVDTVFMHLAAAMKVPRQFVIETPTVNPCILPLRDDWQLIPNPAVGGRNLDFYRYDGRPIAGTPEEIRRLMEGVTVEAVKKALEPALA